MCLAPLHRLRKGRTLAENAHAAAQLAIPNVGSFMRNQSFLEVYLEVEGAEATFWKDGTFKVSLQFHRILESVTSFTCLMVYSITSTTSAIIGRGIIKAVELLSRSGCITSQITTW